jgi:hypothetical protein
LKALQLRPRGVGGEQRVWANIEWRLGAELPPPQTNGADVLKNFIQHDRDLAQDIRQAARQNFEFEINTDDLAETLSDPHRLADSLPHSA